MISAKRLICSALLAIIIVFGPGYNSGLAAEEGCIEAVEKIDALSSKVSNDMRRIQREIAVLRADIDKSGLQEMFGGLGYIFGLFGVAFFFASRRKRKGE